MTEAKRLWHPCYSHGGNNEPGWPAVVGNANNSGRPIQVGGSHPAQHLWPTLTLILKAGSATIFIDANGGELDANGAPPADEWVDVSNGGIAMTAGDSLGKRLSPSMPYYRTRIEDAAGLSFVSYVPLIVLPDGRTVSASHPHKIG